MKKTFIAKIEITLPYGKHGYVGDEECCQQIKNLLNEEIGNDLKPKITVTTE